MFGLLISKSSIANYNVQTEYQYRVLVKLFQNCLIRTALAITLSNLIVIFSMQCCLFL